MSFQSTISCPDCGSDIHLDSHLLLCGSSFKCTNASCHVSISLDNRSMEDVKDAFDKFNALKEKSIQDAKATDTF